MKRIRNFINFYPIFEWAQLVQTCNWYTFTICSIYYELDAMCGAWDVNVCLLGIGFHLRIVYNETSKMAELLAQAEQEMDRAIPFAEVKKDLDKNELPYL